MTIKRGILEVKRLKIMKISLKLKINEFYDFYKIELLPPKGR
jgi:hypothetical protein